MKMPLAVGACLVGLMVWSPGPAKDVRASGAAWEAVGPEGGNVKGIAFHPADAQAALAVVNGFPSSIFKSADAGRTWRRLVLIQDYLVDTAWDPIDAGIAYALGNTRFHKSSDGGTTWTSASYGSGIQATSRILIAASSPGTLFASGFIYQNGRYSLVFLKSPNRGASWTATKIGAAAGSATSPALAFCAANPRVFFLSGQVFDGTTTVNRVYKSADGGTSWLDVTGAITTSMAIDALAVDPLNPLKAYAGTAWAVFRTTDGGASWQKNNGIAFSSALAVDGANPNTVYAGYDKIVYRSSDGGVTWVPQRGALSGLCRVILAAGGQVFFGSTGGLFRSEDAGASWLASHSGMRATFITAVAASPSSPNVVYSEVSGLGFFKSTDYGASWKRCPDFYRCESIIRIAVHPTDADESFILAGG
jgi:photosystem II stability/assembly factor-like uncharacterized protein